MPGFRTLERGERPTFKGSKAWHRNIESEYHFVREGCPGWKGATLRNHSFHEYELSHLIRGGNKASMRSVACAEQSSGKGEEMT